jgi:hypothetical protein
MSDTPETDAKASPHIGFYSCATVPAELCRRLERERDEAREERDILKLAAQREAEHHDRMVGELEKVYKERDEAVRQRNETNESSVYSCNFYYEEKLAAERERDELRNQLNALREHRP